jgi:hypothetical protein
MCAALVSPTHRAAVVGDVYLRTLPYVLHVKHELARWDTIIGKVDIIAISSNDAVNYQRILRN